jgi:HlyD family secretion protein
VVKYNCVIQVDNSDLALKPGMTATVAIEVDRRTDVLKVANEALRFVPQLSATELDRLRGELSAGEAMLWIPAASGLEPRKVQTGLAGEKETEIADPDMAEGMSVAVPRRKRDTPRFRPLSLF